MTDVSLPGNDKLPVEFSRSYFLFNRKNYGDLGMLGDWVVNVPSISAVVATNWTMGSTQTLDRCTNGGFPSYQTPFRVSDFWQGVQIDIPGVANGELLRTYATSPKPSDGNSYYWVTNEQVHVSCLSTLKSGDGQGFLAITPDGTRYWFDWMGQTPEAASISAVYQPGGSRITNILNRKKTYLYATRVEDRFGNYVTYSYSNAWNAPGRLTQIASSDGRTLTVSYSGPTISAVSDGTRTWSYSYATTTSGRKTLTAVTLPDASAWSINFSEFTNAEIKYNEWPPQGEIMRTCTMNEMPLNETATFTGTVMHPSSGVASFVATIREHGRSFVPVACYNVLLLAPSYSPLSNNPNDDQNLYATSAYSLTLKEKSVSGPGIALATWTYGYSPNFSVYRYPGTTIEYPVCDTDNYNCSLPPCTSDTCARSSVTRVTAPDGGWIRYYYGNTYRYNEGKLLKQEWGDAAGNVLKRVSHVYDLSLQSGVYPFAYGSSTRASGEGFPSMYHRPLISTATDQQGVRFSYQINSFDAFARPTNVTRSTGLIPPDPEPNPDPDPEEPPPAPAVPVLTVPVTSITRGTQFAVSWTSAANATQYILERKHGSAVYSTSYSGPNTSTTPLAHTAGTSSFRVKACNGSVCSGYSAIKSVSITGGGGGGVEP